MNERGRSQNRRAGSLSRNDTYMYVKVIRTYYYTCIKYMYLYPFVEDWKPIAKYKYKFGLFKKRVFIFYF